MRPRGESISSPQSTYVGQVGRQKPQWTQSSISSCSGGWWSSKAGSTATPASGRPAPSVALSAWPGSAPTSSGSPSGPLAPTWVAEARSWAGSGPCPVCSVISDASHEPARAEAAVWVEPLLDPAQQPERVAGRAPGVDGPLELGRGLDQDQAAAAGGQPLPGRRDPLGAGRDQPVAGGGQLALAVVAGHPEHAGPGVGADRPHPGQRAVQQVG